MPFYDLSSSFLREGCSLDNPSNAPPGPILRWFTVNMLRGFEEFSGVLNHLLPENPCNWVRVGNVAQWNLRIVGCGISEL